MRKANQHSTQLAAALLGAALFGAAMLFAAPAGAGDRLASVGQPAPAFALTDLSGHKILLQQFKGKPLYLNFFSTWCPPCKLELPEIVKRYPQFKGKVAFLGLDQEESPDLLKPFLAHYGIRYAVGIDEGEAAGLYGVQALPESVFIDRRGIVRAIWRGFIPPKMFLTDMALITS